MGNVFIAFYGNYGGRGSYNSLIIEQSLTVKLLQIVRRRGTFRDVEESETVGALAEQSNPQSLLPGTASISYCDRNH